MQRLLVRAEPSRAGQVAESGKRRIARTRLKKAFNTGLVKVGDRNWSRDDLYAR